MLEEIETLIRAYHVAGRALDRGMRRAGGATAAEWQAEDDARIVLRGARRAYADTIRETIMDSAAYQMRTLAGPRMRPQRPAG